MCEYRCHGRCVDGIFRRCASVKVAEDASYILEICPEVGLSAQNYKCAECKRLITNSEYRVHLQLLIVWTVKKALVWISFRRIWVFVNTYQSIWRKLLSLTSVSLCSAWKKLFKAKKKKKSVIVWDPSFEAGKCARGKLKKAVADRDSCVWGLRKLIVSLKIGRRCVVVWSRIWMAIHLTCSPLYFPEACQSPRFSYSIPCRPACLLVTQGICYQLECFRLKLLEDTYNLKHYTHCTLASHIHLGQSRWTGAAYTSVYFGLQHSMYIK